MAETQDTGAAVTQPDQSPDQEWQALQSDAAMLARNYQELAMAEAMLEEQIRTGQVPADQALSIKENIRQRRGHSENAARGLSEREQAYNDRMRKADEAQVMDAFPEWADGKLKAQETRRLTDYLHKRGMSQGDMERLGAPEIIKHTRAMRKTIYENMTPEQRRMHDLNGKLQAKQVAEAERSAPPKAAPDESPRVVANITQEDTDEMTGMWAESIKTWEAENGRKLTNRERRVACLTGSYPRR